MKLAYRKQIFFILTALMCVSAVLYVYFINQAVRDVVQREALEEQIGYLATKIGEVEFEYIQKKSNIDIDLAYSMGYSDIDDATYISRKTAVSMLSR